MKQKPLLDVRLLKMDLAMVGSVISSSVPVCKKSLPTVNKLIIPSSSFNIH